MKGLTATPLESRESREFYYVSVHGQVKRALGYGPEIDSPEPDDGYWYLPRIGTSSRLGSGLFELDERDAAYEYGISIARRHLDQAQRIFDEVSAGRESSP